MEGRIFWDRPLRMPSDVPAFESEGASRADSFSVSSGLDSSVSVSSDRSPLSECSGGRSAETFSGSGALKEISKLSSFSS